MTYYHFTDCQKKKENIWYEYVFGPLVIQIIMEIYNKELFIIIWTKILVISKHDIYGIKLNIMGDLYEKQCKTNIWFQVLQKLQEGSNFSKSFQIQYVHGCKNLFRFFRWYVRQGSIAFVWCKIHTTTNPEDVACPRSPCAASSGESCLGSTLGLPNTHTCAISMVLIPMNILLMHD